MFFRATQLKGIYTFVCPQGVCVIFYHMNLMCIKYSSKNDEKVLPAYL